MFFFCILSGEHPALATAEIETLLEVSTKKDGLVRTFQSNRTPPLLKRLAYTSVCCHMLFSCPASALERRLQSFPWQKVYQQNFRAKVIDFTGSAKPSKHYGSIIWRQLSKPTVDMENPVTDVRIVLTRRRAYVGLVRWQNGEDFESRKAHRRPGFLPTSLHPKLARACVNLLGPRAKKIVDPFCGSGGFLIEASLMGLAVEGYDIDEKALDAARKNLLHYGITKFTLLKKDALTLPATAHIATDLPYGRATKTSKPVKQLVRSFSAVLKKRLTGSAVIMTLSGGPQIDGIRPKKKFAYYIHRSMTKRILVF